MQLSFSSSQEAPSPFLTVAFQSLHSPLQILPWTPYTHCQQITLAATSQSKETLFPGTPSSSFQWADTPISAVLEGSWGGGQGGWFSKTRPSPSVLFPQGPCSSLSLLSWYIFSLYSSSTPFSQHVNLTPSLPWKSKQQLPASSWTRRPQVTPLTEAAVFFRAVALPPWPQGTGLWWGL